LNKLKFLFLNSFLAVGLQAYSQTLYDDAVSGKNVAQETSTTNQ